MTSTHVLDIRGESTGYPIHFDQEFPGTEQDAEQVGQSLANQAPVSAVVVYFDGEHVATVSPKTVKRCEHLADWMSDEWAEKCTACHLCPKGHGPMVERTNPDALASSLGTWFDCPHHTCRDSFLVPVR